MGAAAWSTGSVDAGLLLLRIVVGVGFSLHGFQKLFGWFGGGGLDATAKWFASLGFGHGHVAARLAGSTEIAGGLGLALGLLTPFAAAGIVATMTTAAFVNAHEHGFWSAKKGWELNLYLIVVAAAVAITGPGQWSIDVQFGFDRWFGPLVGLLAVVVGFVGGTLRWVTRDR